MSQSFISVSVIHKKGEKSIHPCHNKIGISLATCIMSEKFSLQWKDYNQNAVKFLSSLRLQEDFYDVTLVGDDQEQFSAHKVVLSACSEYFANVLKKNKHSHPLLCLEGISSNELKSLLDYIYSGEAQIFQEDIDRFLQIAQRLHLNGITEKNNKVDNVKVQPDHKRDQYEAYENVQSTEVDVTSENIDIPIKEESVAEVSNRPPTLQDPTNLSEVNRKIEELMERIDWMWNCKLCGKSSKRKQDLQKHVETHIEGLSFPCLACGNVFRYFYIPFEIVFSY